MEERGGAANATVVESGDDSGPCSFSIRRSRWCRRERSGHRTCSWRREDVSVLAAPVPPAILEREEGDPNTRRGRRTGRPAPREPNLSILTVKNAAAHEGKYVLRRRRGMRSAGQWLRRPPMEALATAQCLLVGRRWIEDSIR